MDLVAERIALTRLIVQGQIKDFLLNSWEVLGSLLGRSCSSEGVRSILLGRYLAGNIS